MSQLPYFFAVAAVEHLIDEEVCPSCGGFVTYIVPVTGWCFLCTLPLLIDKQGGEKDGKCLECGNSTDETHRYCRSCRRNRFLEEHANEIDLCLSFGVSVTKAIELISTNALIKCKSCGDTMRKSATGESHFCTKKPQCRTAHRKLKYLVYEKGMKRDEALTKVLEDLARNQ